LIGSDDLVGIGTEGVSKPDWVVAIIGINPRIHTRTAEIREINGSLGISSNVETDDQCCE